MRDLCLNQVARAVALGRGVEAWKEHCERGVALRGRQNVSLPFIDSKRILTVRD